MFMVKNGSEQLPFNILVLTRYQVRYYCF